MAKYSIVVEAMDAEDFEKSYFVDYPELSFELVETTPNLGADYKVIANSYEELVAWITEIYCENNADLATYEIGMIKRI